MYPESITVLTAFIFPIQLIFSAIPVLLFYYQYLIDRNTVSRIWASAWALNLATDILEIYLAFNPSQTWILVLGNMAKVTSAYLLMHGFQTFFNRPRKLFGKLGLILCLGWLILGTWFNTPYKAIAVPPLVFLTATYGFIIDTLLKLQINQPLLTLPATGALTIWGVFNLVSTIADPGDWYWVWGYQAADIVQLIFAVFVIRIYLKTTSRILSAPELTLRTLIENTGSIVYSYKLYPVPKLDYVSPSVEKITGYSHDEFLADKTLIFRIAHRDDRRDLVNLTRSIIDAPGQALVLRLWRRDAAMVWVEHINLPIFDESGNLVGIHGSARDITPQRQLDGRDYLIKEVALMVVEDKPLNVILSHVCDRLIDIYGLNMDWIGMKEPDGRVSVGAASGGAHPVNNIYRLKVRWDTEHGAAGKVIRSGKTLIMDFTKEIFQPWYDLLAARKIRSVASFPLKTKGNTLGALVLYSSHDAFFNKRMVSEIEDFCEQIALAINDSITKRQLTLVTTGLQSTKSGVVITDRNFLILWNNPAFSKLTYYDENEVRNNRFSELIAGLTLSSPSYETLRETVLTGLTWRQEIELRQKNNSSAFVEMVVTPVKDDTGQPSHFIIALHDLAQRKQAEAALQRYQLLYEQANDIIFIMRTDGRIIEANPAAVKSYGYSKKELLSMRVDSSFAPIIDSSVTPDAVLRDITSATIGSLFESQHHRKDGTPFPVEVSSAHSVIGGEQVIFSIIRDISDRKQAELHKLQMKETIAQAEKLASLGRMAAGISHEINQPLNSIKVITDSIQYWHRRGIMTEMPDIMKAIGNISAQADRIDKIIKHVRNFIHSKNSLSLVPCDLNSAIESVLHLLETQLYSHKIEHIQNLASGLPQVAATPTGLEQILINLIVNSIQALEASGKAEKTLTITTFLVDTVVMEISDNGPGIEESIKTKIFEPFFTTNNFSDGMGLGLAITQSIISSYNGKISIISNEQAGATFRVELPVWRQNTQEVI